MTHKEKTIESLKILGGHAFLKDIYEVYATLEPDATLSQHYQASIRDTLERNSSDSEKFNGKNDIFYSVEGKGNGHWGLRDYSTDDVELTQDDDCFCEGKQLLKKHIVRERNPMVAKKAKLRFKSNHNNKIYCEICGFDFYKYYGTIGEDFIEAHHIKPISQMSIGEKTNIEDIILLCSNCHSMIHRKKPWLTRDQLHTLLIKKL